VVQEKEDNHEEHEEENFIKYFDDKIHITVSNNKILKLRVLRVLRGYPLSQSGTKLKLSA
jgi:hypothetical protein